MALLFLFAVAAPSALRPTVAAAAGGLSARIQTSLGTDSNVLETVAEARREEDGFGRFLGELGWAGGVPPLRATAAVSGRVLAERFVDHPDEDRIQGELRAAFDLDLPGARGHTRLEFGGAARDHPDSTARNHRRGWIRAAVGVPLGPRGRFVTRADVWVVDFHRTPRQDQRGLAVDLAYEHPLGRGLTGQVGLEIGGVKHGVPSIQVLRPAPGATPEPALGADRQDDYRDVHVGFRWLRRWLLHARYGYRAQQSNSVDAAWHRHELEWLAAVPLPARFTAQFFGTLQHTDYTDRDLDDVLVVRSGEVEAGDDNNAVSVGLSRPVTAAWTAEGRVSWYQNESLIVGDYYNKRVVSLGLSWEGGGASAF